MSFQPLKGFRDFLPPDASNRARVTASLRETARRAGFEEVETPSLESLELFKVKSGEGIVEETFSFTDKGGREVTLVPENTPSVARLLVSRIKVEPLPVKWVAFCRLWRYEDPQSGRTREFSQCSLDIFGVPGVEAELELLATASQMLEGLGLQGEFVFRLNDRRLLQGLSDALAVKVPEAFHRALDRREKLSPREFDQELERAGLSPEGRERLGGLFDLAQRAPDGTAGFAEVRSELERWGLSKIGTEGLRTLEELYALGERAGRAPTWRFDPSLVRGLAYYTGIVFEAYDRKGELRALFGGGRYDKLVELFGGGSVPACGLAIGDVRLELLLRRRGRWPERSDGLDVYVATADGALREEALTLVERLRRRGFSADRDLLGRPLARQMRDASRRSSAFVVLLAPKEREQGSLILRNMRSGRQDVVPVASLEDALAAGRAAAGPRGPAGPGAPSGA
jgi:histidyl-tRNA synthetase